MKFEKYNQKDNFILGLFGMILFFLVISVIYIMILISELTSLKEFQIFMPLIVFSGFFIFLIGAMLLALSIFKAFGGFR